MLKLHLVVLYTKLYSKSTFKPMDSEHYW